MLFMQYILYSHDAWGTAEIGRFQALEQAKKVFEELRVDRWFLADGTVKGLSIAEICQEGSVRTIDSYRFSQD